MRRKTTIILVAILLMGCSFFVGQGVEAKTITIGSSTEEDIINVKGKLDVKNDIMTAAGKKFCIGSSCISSWTEVANSGFWKSGTGGIYYNGGNVGIGTTNPGADKLAVVGTLSASNGIKVSGSSFGNFIYGRLGVGHGTAGV